MLKIKEYWGKILIYIFGIPPSIIAEQCSDELRKELKLTKKRFKHTEIVQDGQTIVYGIEDTEKRYVYNVIGDGIYDVSEKQLIDLLNNQHEEIQRLKLKIDGLDYALKNIKRIDVEIDLNELEK